MSLLPTSSNKFYLDYYSRFACLVLLPIYPNEQVICTFCFLFFCSFLMVKSLHVTALDRNNHAWLVQQRLLEYSLSEI